MSNYLAGGSVCFVKKIFKKIKKTIDNLWIICYNKDAPRGWQDRGE